MRVEAEEAGGYDDLAVVMAGDVFEYVLETHFLVG